MAGKKKQNPAQAAAPELTTDSAPGTSVVVHAAKGLNLRVGPGREHAIREVLADGTELIDATPELPGGAEVPGWVFVRKNDGGAGWVDVRFVKAKEG